MLRYTILLTRQITFLNKVGLKSRERQVVKVREHLALKTRYLWFDAFILFLFAVS